jgi:cytochrome c-type biogenesis protein CcmH/NrfG
MRTLGDNMEDPQAKPAVSIGRWRPGQAYLLAAVCLVTGVLLGYGIRDVRTSVPATSVANASAPPSGGAQPMPSLEQMKHMADKQAEPLLAQLQGNPKDPELLGKIGTIYKSTHQFKDAADYYQRSLQLAPANVQLRNELASCLYYTGDIDGALLQLQQSLKTDGKNPDALFNQGIIRWKGKNDIAGAISSWQQLLKSNPGLPSDKRAQVEKLIADVKGGSTMGR